MREIVLDTETTGLDPRRGDRVVEIGCVELINHIPTENEFHVYINPQRDMPTAAFEVHGLSEEFLADKPLFADIAQDFLDFIGESPLIIHNASFDMGFLNAELKMMNRPALPPSRAIDTLMMARKKFPGSPGSLDALCRRYNVDLTVRDKHGALIDSILLARVYLELIGGAQPDLDLTSKEARKVIEHVGETEPKLSTRPRPLPSSLTHEELEAHLKFLEDELGTTSKWLQ